MLTVEKDLYDNLMSIINLQLTLSFNLWN